jgi:hypothetical protein
MSNIRAAAAGQVHGGDIPFQFEPVSYSLLLGIELVCRRAWKITIARRRSPN